MENAHVFAQGETDGRRFNLHLDFHRGAHPRERGHQGFSCARGAAQLSAPVRRASSVL